MEEEKAGVPALNQLRIADPKWSMQLGHAAGPQTSVWMPQPWNHVCVTPDTSASSASPKHLLNVFRSLHLLCHNLGPSH